MRDKILKPILTCLFIIPIGLMLIGYGLFLSLIDLIANPASRRKNSSPPSEIVFVTYAPFRGLFTRHLQIATKLSSSFSVIYCDLISISTLLVSPKLIGELGFSRIAPKLYRLAALILPFDGRFAPFTAINRFLLTSYLKGAIRRSGFSHFALFLWEPTREYLAGKLGEALSIYDIVDEYSELLGSAEKILAAEARLFKKTDLVLSGTYSLFLSRKKLHRNIHFIPCGVDYELFSSPPPSPPVELADIPRPIIGYYGMLDDRIDVDLLRFIGEKYRKWSFVMIGPVRTSFSSVSKLENFYFLGKKDYRLLPGYLGSFDVAIIPYLLNRLTEHINPNKMLEILAAGKPVVTADIPDIKRFYSDIAFVSKGYEEFAGNLKRALSDKRTEERINRGKKMAEENSWDKTANRIKELINKTYFAKTKPSSREKRGKGG
jgi:glycosyltransferase involved in cell wall biosynthesis